MVMKTLLLVDNQDITREGMKAVAGRVGGFTVIKEAGSQKELTRLLIDHPNAVVVLDYTLFDTSAEYLLILQERFKEAHFILFSDSLSEDFIRRMVFGGTSFSVVMKDAPMIEIEEGLRKAEQRLQYICTRIAWQLQHKEEKKEKTEEDEYLDVESAKDKEVDYSKYEEKKSNGSADKKNSEGTDTDGDGSENSGSSSEDLVTYSDGTSTEKDQYQTDPIPEGNPNPVEPGSVEIDKSKPGTCYLSIACDTILNHMGDLTEGKDVLVPEDGIIFSEQEVTFYQGESVYDVLLRETQNNRIHMEASFTPMYNSAYVEGINNLYEFDCGQYSGWMYEVNGWYPNYGCSRYLVKEGDVIHWNYTCDLGRDLGQIWEG